VETKYHNFGVLDGMHPGSIKLGMLLTDGRFWVRPEGCHVIYRGLAGVIDYQNIQAVMEIDGESVEIGGQDLGISSSWSFVRRQVSGCGLESSDSPVCIVVTDADGEMQPLVPNAPVDLAASQAAGGKVVLTWRYNSMNEQIKPAGFHIYIDSGSGFDLETPAGDIRYGGFEGRWTSEALVHGQSYSFIVRAYSQYGEEENSNSIDAVPDAVGPAVIETIEVSVQQV
jgi:hypothetical protein